MSGVGVKDGSNAGKKPVRPSSRPVAAPKTHFTVREMNRLPQALLEAAQRLGRVVIHSRSRGKFVLTPEVPASDERVREAEAFMERQRAFRGKLSRIRFVPPSKTEAEKIARMIAGEWL